MGKWKSSEYSMFKKNPFEVGEYYHIAFLGHFDDLLTYQGIFKYTDNGFIENGYNIRPFPTHYIHIKKPLSLSI